MRNLLFFAALAASTAAVAQTTSDPNASGNMDQTATQQPTDADPAMSQQGTMSTQDSTNQNMAGQGSMGQGSMDQQSMGQQGTMSQGTMSQGSMSQGTMSQGSMSGGMSVAPGNQAPERDARGIAVMSDPAMAPAGANQMAPGGGTVVPASNQAAVFTTQASTENYPACSRTVTDNCVQSYERGRRPR